MVSASGVLWGIAFYLTLSWPLTGLVIYVDAKRHDVPRPAVQAVTFGLLGPLGVLIYCDIYGDYDKQTLEDIPEGTI